MTSHQHQKRFRPFDSDFFYFRTLQAIISDYQYLYYRLSKDQSCQLRLVADSLFRFGLGFATKKNLPWKVLIDQMLLKHRERETFAILQNKWFSNICQPTFFASTKNQLSINRFGGIILILILTAILSFPLLFPEYLYSKYLESKITKFLRRKEKPSLQKKGSLFDSYGSSLDNSGKEP